MNYAVDSLLNISLLYWYAKTVIKAISDWFNWNSGRLKKKIGE